MYLNSKLMFLSSSGALPGVEQHEERSTNPYTGSRCSTPKTLASRLSSGGQSTEPTVPHFPPQAAVHDSSALPVAVLLSPLADGGQVTEPSVSHSPSQAMVLASGAISDVDFGGLGTNPTGSRRSIPVILLAKLQQTFLHRFTPPKFCLACKPPPTTSPTTTVSTHPRLTNS